MIPPPEWRARGTYAEHRGHRVFVVDEGSGEDVLLCLHGFPSSSWDWNRMWGELVARFRVVAPDLLGYGFSAKPRRYAYTIADHADTVEEQIGRAHV